MFNPRRNRKGFTIIELIVVIAIIAILAAIAIPSFVGLTKQADERVALANGKMIAQAINTYNTLNPNSEIPALTDAQATLSATGVNLWPAGMTADDVTKAMAKITYTGGVATVTDERDAGTSAAAS